MKAMERAGESSGEGAVVRGCNHCDEALVAGVNWPKHRVGKHDFICKSCHYKRNLQANRERNETEDQPGYIYGMVNDFEEPGITKIGRTLDPSDRLRRYNTESKAKTCEMAFIIPVETWLDAENIAREVLDHYLYRGKEYFELGPSATLAHLLQHDYFEDCHVLRGLDELEDYLADKVRDQLPD